MKKIISVALALALVLSLGISAFATITVDGTTEDSPCTVNGDAKWVKANETDEIGDDLTVTGSVTGENGKTSVTAGKGATIDVKGSVKESDTPGATALNHAISAAGSATVKVGGNVEEGGNEGSGGNAINVLDKGARVEVTGYVIEKGSGYAIVGSGTVIVKNDVTESGDGDAIYAANGAKVTVGKNVTENDDGDAIYAANDAKVTVGGDVTESGDGNAIKAKGTSMVTVGGNVTGNDAGSTINAQEDATIIVEGRVTGNINLYENAVIYLSQLKGDISSTSGASLDNVHYLIGFADDSAKYDKDFKKITDYHFLPFSIIGVNEKKYLATSSAIPANLDSAFIVFGATDSSKKLTVDEATLPVGVDTEILENGQLKLKLSRDFTGGLQNLVLKLVEIPTPGPDPTPVYYIVPLGSVTTASVKLPAGVAEGLIKALDSADHAGITVDSSLVGDGSVKVLKDGKELSAKDFSTYTHADGSIDVILSNTYLYALGSGSYDFTAVVGGTEIGFSVLVAV